MARVSHFVSRERRLIIIIVELGVESRRRGFYAASIQEVWAHCLVLNCLAAVHCRETETG
jgi:hypothetical protein